MEVGSYATESSYGIVKMKKCYYTKIASLRVVKIANASSNHCAVGFIEPNTKFKQTADSDELLQVAGDGSNQLTSFRQRWIS